jgi:FG-GAP repeat
VFSAAGVMRTSFLAYHPLFMAGVFVAAGDVDGDGLADIITGADAGGGPHVLVFSGVDNHLLRSFFAYDPAFAGGVRVAAGDLDLDGHAEIITAPGSGDGSNVRVWDGATGSMTLDLATYGPAVSGGVFVAAAPPQPRISIDLPLTATVPPVFTIAGWATDGLATADSGVDAIHVWAIPIAGGAPVFVGVADLGFTRGDIAAIFGGFYSEPGYALIGGPLAPGTYDVYVFAHSARSATFNNFRIVRITVTP